MQQRNFREMMADAIITRAVLVGWRPETDMHPRMSKTELYLHGLRQGRDVAQNALSGAVPGGCWTWVLP